MRLRDIGEFGLIEKISNGCLIRPRDVHMAIGDDAAVFAIPEGHVSVVTTDMLVERVHFMRQATSPYNLGYKAMAVNVSDIAAMGADALSAFVSIAIPSTCSVEFITQLYDGMKALASDFGLNILGGDTTHSKKDLIINITVVGSAAVETIMYRHSAKPGDRLYTTDVLGDSRAGLYLLMHYIAPESRELKDLIRAHLLPRPHLREGRFLAKETGVHAAMDISDGLSADITRLAAASGVGIRIYADDLPVSSQLKSFCAKFGFNPLDFALSGGEEYCLVFSVDETHAKEIENRFRLAFDHKIHCIGDVTHEKQNILITADGEAKPLDSSGWDHFQS